MIHDSLESLAGKTVECPDVDIDWWPGRMLLLLRDNLEYSRRHVAERLRISPERVASYESERTRMPSEIIVRAAEFFGVLPSAFFKKVSLTGEVDHVLDRIAFDYEFEQMLCRLDDDQRRKLLDVAHILF